MFLSDSKVVLNGSIWGLDMDRFIYYSNKGRIYYYFFLTLLLLLLEGLGHFLLLWVMNSDMVCCEYFLHNWFFLLVYYNSMNFHHIWVVAWVLDPVGSNMGLVCRLIFNSGVLMVRQCFGAIGDVSNVCNFDFHG